MSKLNIKIRQTKNSRLSKVDFNNIPFGKTFSDHMFIADYKNGKWTNLRIEPFKDLKFSPANLTLHYGQSIFEGMKAAKNFEGTPLLLRPEMHVERMNISAARMSMPAIPKEIFMEGLAALVDLDSDWIPTVASSSLYIRPLMFATDEFIGVAPSSTYRFIIMTGPAGAYYNKPVRLIAEDTYVRAVKGGIGEAKTAGNYAASLLPAKIARDRGFDQVMWMDAKEFKYIQEVGTMNLFFVINGKVVTPATDGAILKGITRNSFLTILKEKGYVVEERLLSIDEVMAAHDAGQLQEAFGSGTAAVMTPVQSITYQGKTINLPAPETFAIGNMLKSEIEGLRNGTIKDTRGWLVPIQSKILVS